MGIAHLPQIAYSRLFLFDFLEVNVFPFVVLEYLFMSARRTVGGRSAALPAARGVVAVARGLLPFPFRGKHGRERVLYLFHHAEGGDEDKGQCGDENAKQTSERIGHIALSCGLILVNVQ